MSLAAVTFTDDISSKVMEFPGVVAGTFAFSNQVAPEELINLALEWKGRGDGSRYLDLHVRSVSKDAFGIGFKYHLPQNDPFHERYRVRIKDELRVRFGGNFIGCHIGHPVWQIL
jgi:hypothetical protein